MQEHLSLLKNHPWIPLNSSSIHTLRGRRYVSSSFVSLSWVLDTGIVTMSLDCHASCTIWKQKINRLIYAPRTPGVFPSANVWIDTCCFKDQWLVLIDSQYFEHLGTHCWWPNVPTPSRHQSMSCLYLPNWLGLSLDILTSGPVSFCLWSTEPELRPLFNKIISHIRPVAVISIVLSAGLPMSASHLPLLHCLSCGFQSP